MSGVVSGQQPSQSKAGNQGHISVEDVCAAAVPWSEQGNQFQWSPDGRSIAYFKPVTTGYGLRVELDSVNADGSARTILLSGPQIDKLFPPKPTGHKGALVAPSRAAAGFQWAPDGSGILLFNDLHIYWLDRKTLQTKKLVAGDEPISDVQLSPDGQLAAFVRGRNLWTVNVAGGNERAVTTDGNDTLRKGELDWMYPEELGTRHGYAWSPDSSRIAYLEFDLKGVASYTPPFQLAEDKPVPTIDYPTPGSKNPRVKVLIQRVGDRSPAIAVNTGNDDVYLPRLQWLPDGKRLAIERLNRPQSRLDLLLADASNGTTHLLLSEIDRYWINLSDILYFMKKSPQFVWSSERSGYRHLYLYGLDGKLIRQLTGGEWEVTSLDAVNEDKQEVYFSATQRTPLERHLYVAGFDGGESKWVTAETGTHEATFSPDASSYVDNFSSAAKPWSRSLYKIEGPSASKIFALDQPPIAAGNASVIRPVNFLTMKTHDGVPLNALLMQPAGFSPDKKYPAIVYVEGGPGDQAVRDRWNGDVSEWQRMLVQRGYIVFAVDGRGSSGRGHVFEEYLHYKLTGQDASDQQDGVDFLKTLPYVDPERIGVWGRGFGGMLTVNAMLHPRLGFKAGFAVAPIVDWFRYDSAFTERYLGDPVENQDGYLSSSPLDDADALKNPLLVAQGTADLRVHPEQAMELQHEFVEARKHVEIGLYPGQGHTIDNPDACVVSYRRATEFFAKSL